MGRIAGIGYKLGLALMMAFAWWWAFGGMHAVFITGVSLECLIHDIFLVSVGVVGTLTYFWFSE
jgi:hypothetical protein